MPCTTALSLAEVLRAPEERLGLAADLTAIRAADPPKAAVAAPTVRTPVDPTLAVPRLLRLLRPAPNLAYGFTLHFS